MNYLPSRRAKTRPRMMAPKEGSPIRSTSYLAWVRGHNCVCVESDPTGCGGKIEAAHVRRGTDGGTSMKPGDNWTYPACSNHHAEQHRVGEVTFEKTYRFSLKQIANRLWLRWLNTTDSGLRFRRSHPPQPSQGEQ